MSSPTPSGDGRPPTRLGAARERAYSPKLALSAGALASFGVAMMLVKAGHTASTAGDGSGAQPSGSAAAPADTFAAETSGGFQPGSIAPAAGPPTASTRAS